MLKILTLLTQKSFRTHVQEESSGYQDLKEMLDLAPEFLKLKQCLEQTVEMVISALRGVCSQRALSLEPQASGFLV